MAKVKKKKAKKKLSKEARALARMKTSHTRMLRSSFREAGFDEISELRDFEFTFDGFTSDTDDVFIHENLLIIVERTTAANPSEHYKKKLAVYNHIESNYSDFVTYIRSLSQLSGTDFIEKYEANECIVKIVYCSRFELEEKHKSKASQIKFFDYSVLRYFYAISRAIKKTSLPEYFEFLGIDTLDVGVEGAMKTSHPATSRDCLILSNSHANLPDGFKVISLYLDAETILNSVYVLRKQGWSGDINAYQRMLVPKKIKDIREYIVHDGHVFMNNVIITLPADTVVKEKGKKNSGPSVSRVKTGSVSIGHGPSSIGVVDGQHRILSFYVGEPFEKEMLTRRKKQNLLATAIIFPDDYTSQQRQEFEARLFLEINTNQKPLPPALSLSIETLVEPFSDYAIANKVISGLDKKGALQGVIEKYFFETEKLKPASIVKFQLSHLVRIPKEKNSSASRPKNLFDYWDGSGKKNLIGKTEYETGDYTKLGKYIEYCIEQIDAILLAVKRNSPNGSWTAARSVENRVLTTLNVNAILACLRERLKSGEPLSHIQYMKKFESFDFSNYPNFKSSQYNKMGQKIYLDLF